MSRPGSLRRVVCARLTVWLLEAALRGWCHRLASLVVWGAWCVAFPARAERDAVWARVEAILEGARLRGAA